MGPKKKKKKTATDNMSVVSITIVDSCTLCSEFIYFIPFIPHVRMVVLMVALDHKKYRGDPCTVIKLLIIEMCHISSMLMFCVNINYTYNV